MTSEIELTEIERIGEGFLTHTFPGCDFHHREHLVMMVYMLFAEPGRNWRRDLPELIREYNVSQGGQNTDTSGYHHTITLFFIDLITTALKSDPQTDVVRACSQILNGPASDKELVLRFYSRELLYSVEARRGYVAPDKEKIDFETLAKARNPCLNVMLSAGDQAILLPERTL